jgi:hypothetical protein
VVGLAAWQQAWATLDFYVRPGPDAVTVERDIFAWAGASASATPNAGTGCRTRWSSATTPNRRSPAPGGDREDLQPRLVDQVVLDQRAYELKAAGDDDVPVYVLL